MLERNMGRSSIKRGAESGTVMAFDYGRRRIGVAVGDCSVGIAHPLDTVHYATGEDPLLGIASMVAEWKPNLFAVGWPVGEDGEPHKLAPAVKGFSRALTRRFGVQVHLVDERYTSVEASGMLCDAGVRGQRQKAYLDQVAAQTILEDFFVRCGNESNV